MPPRDFLVFGGSGRPTRPLYLQAGPLTMFFDPATVFLRRIYLHQTEVIRGIYAAVRDLNWGTVSPRLDNLKVEAAPEAFRLSFGVACRQKEIDFHWRGEITGAPEGIVSFRFDGEAQSSFFRNRIGFCLLHPLADCAGRECEVEHIDGSRERGIFPQFISPHQPFKRIRAIRHKVQSRVWIEARFKGDVFEMEDQRNWTDASFKTYCTPLECPFPVRIDKGQRVRQEITVRVIERGGGDAHQLSHQTPPEHPTDGTQVVIRTSEPPPLVIPATPLFPLPPIGLGMASHGQPLTLGEVQRLKLLRLSHVRVDLPLGEAGWLQTLRRASREAGQLGCRLHLALFLTDNAERELEFLVDELKALEPPVALWMVYHVNELTTTQTWIDLAKAALGRFASNIPFAAGTNANFAELNRACPSYDASVLPCFSINPQVHTSDHLSVMENLEAQPHTIATARQFSPQPVVVSPVTLKPRLNAVATGSDGPPPPHELPPAVDQRQASLFVAAWTLGSIAALAGTGRVHNLTYYETAGWRGVMEREGGSPFPDKFPSTPGTVFPVFHIFAFLAGIDQMAPIPGGRDQKFAAITLFSRGQRRVLVANLTSEVLPLSIVVNSASTRLRVIDESTAEEAALNPGEFLTPHTRATRYPNGVVDLALNAYGFACVDLGV